MKTQPATGETYPKSDLFNKAEEDVKKVQDALSLAKMLEDKKLWRRAATVYTSMLGMATTANELWLLARMRNRCLRNVARW
ncbi:PerC family transcriptional regulator [Klebsiella pneumoniae]|nr:PerC family transcriptional regulator [Klebsiella pneumoniae]